jgi:hypothetical protein
VGCFPESWGSESGVSEVDFYAERARYDGKERSRAAIAQEAAAYNARWPKRSFWPLGSPAVETLDGPVHRVRLRAGFAVENDARRVTGEATYQIDLVPRGRPLRSLGWRNRLPDGSRTRGRVIKERKITFRMPRGRSEPLPSYHAKVMGGLVEARAPHAFRMLGGPLVHRGGLRSGLKSWTTVLRFSLVTVPPVTSTPRLDPTC